MKLYKIANGIIQAVVAAGYQADIAKSEAIKHNNKTSQKDNMDITIQDMKKRLIISIFFLIPLMYIAMYHMFEQWFGIPTPSMIDAIFHGNQNAITFAFTQFLLLLPIVYVNRSYFIIGFKRLWKRTPNMDSLIAMGSSAAIIYGILAIYMLGLGLGHHQIDLVEKYKMDLYFEAAGMILTLITLGKYLETKSKRKTSEAISKLMNLAPKTATVIRQEKEMQVSLSDIVIDDIVVIKPGESIGVDGIIIKGNSSIDQASMTGESIPVEKTVGDNVISGTINQNGSFYMKATKVGDNTTLSQIIKLVEEASSSKAPIAKLADKVSGIFVPCVIAISIIATIIWLIQGQSLEFALSIGIAVLVISCPCALGLATPVAIMVGTGRGAAEGILIKSAEALEQLHSVNTVILDKTGTITTGTTTVTDIYSVIDEKELLKIAGSIEKNSTHPLSIAILEKAKQEKVDLIEVQEFKNASGRGVKAKIEDKQYFVGNLAFMKENKIEQEQIDKKANKYLKQGKTVIYIANEEKIIGMLAIQDMIKDTSVQAVKELKRNHLQVIMLTGDNKKVAQIIAKEVGIDTVISEVLPQDKEKEVAKLQENGKKVVFVGDGINDSPALVKADVGIAIGSGTDIAIEAADIVLMKDNLLDVVTAIRLSKAVIRNIKMNLFWAFFYNIIGLPIACGAFYFSLGLKLNPMIGALAMSLSSVCVVTNALRLKNFKPKFQVPITIEREDLKHKEKGKEVIKQMKTIKIEGMQCNHCKMTVEKALNSIDGITKVEVNLENKSAIIENEKEIEDSQIKEVIEAEGFQVMNIK